MSVKELTFIQGTIMPIVKVSEGRYLIGTRIKEIIQRNNGLYVRNGGGFMKIEEFIAKSGSIESLRIEKIIQKQMRMKMKACEQGMKEEGAKMSTFTDAIKYLLKINKCQHANIQKYMKSVPQETNELF